MTYATNVIFGCEGLTLSPEERDLFRRLKPWGLILFSRNIQSPDQLKALNDDFREAVGRADAPILIDQEGGRVSRLPQTFWRIPPNPAVFASIYRKNKQAALKAAYLNYRLIAHDLKSSGVNVNCSPMVDMPRAGTSDIINGRDLGDNPEMSIALARQVIQGLKDGGVAPVVKHVPGHGRATVDSHILLPYINASHSELAESDFLPFIALNDQAMMMTAHIIYEAIDAKRPGTQSPKVINEIIRSQIGFDGLLMTDDINMQALDGSIAERATKSLDAGVDVVLHCSGLIDEMKDVGQVVGELSGKSLLRAHKATAEANLLADDADIEAHRVALEEILREAGQI
jgi:beta-N-acetylhexosaminidase